MKWGNIYTFGEHKVLGAIFPEKDQALQVNAGADRASRKFIQTVCLMSEDELSAVKREVILQAVDKVRDMISRRRFLMLEQKPGSKKAQRYADAIAELETAVCVIMDSEKD